MNAAVQINNLVVLGSGLIGGSIAYAAKQSGLASQVSVVNRSLEPGDAAISMGAADSAYSYEQLNQVLQGLQAGDLVVVAVPVNSYALIFGKIAGHLADGVVLTDVGSTKVNVIDSAINQWGSDVDFFVPGHPIAGSERSGIEAADPGLFQGRRTIVTPMSSNSEQDIALVGNFWRALGAEVDLMDPVHHDEILAATSHLPHLLAYGLVDSLVTLDQKREVFRYAAGGFRDFTRIAESDPVMWRDIFLANSEALAQQLENFESHIKDLRLAIESADAESLQAILERAQTARKLYAETNRGAV